jgi:hypothetical protein
VGREANKRRLLMLQVTMLPAAHGDALWLECGSAARPARVLIDGGPASTYDAVHRHLKKLTKKRKDVDLFVITHIDTDHIDGAILLLRDRELDIDLRDIWFNGWRHLGEQMDRDLYGPEQGEFLSALVQIHKRPWNNAMGGAALCVPDSGPLPVVDLAPAVTLTILSPGLRQLRRLRRNWESAIADAGWDPGDIAPALERLRQRREYTPATRVDRFRSDPIAADNAVANGSSIAFMLECAGRRCLFTGDAPPAVLGAGLERYASERGYGAVPIPIDLVKLPHHGSARNWTLDIERRVTARHYLVSTNGATFHHPDADTLTLLTREMHGDDRHVWFNYRSDTTTAWANDRHHGVEGFVTHYPDVDAAGITVVID